MPRIATKETYYTTYYELLRYDPYSKAIFNSIIFLALGQDYLGLVPYYFPSVGKTDKSLNLRNGRIRHSRDGPTRSENYKDGLKRIKKNVRSRNYTRKSYYNR